MTNKHQWNICLSQHFTVHLCRKRITENLNVAFPFSVCCYPISLNLVSQSRAVFSTVGFLRRLSLSISKKFSTCIEMFPSADLCVKLHNFHNVSRFNLKFYRFVLMFNSPHADKKLVCFVPHCCKRGLNPCRVTLLCW